MPEPIELKSSDSVDVTFLVDNSIDVLLASDDHARRPPVPSGFDLPQLRAEHGFSALVSIRRNGAETTLLYDAGLTAATLPHNLGVLGISVADAAAVVLSHGHGDHHGGLEGLVRRIGRKHLPLVLHPDAWQRRKIVFPTGAEMLLAPPDRSALLAAGAELVEREAPTVLLDGVALVSGRVERSTDFERGMSTHWAEGASGWASDPMIWDDQCLIVRLKGKGLVVLSGCGHAGAVNIVRHAKRLTGEERLHALLGGLHLTGALFEPIVRPTVEALANEGVEYVAPAHCTGWRAQQELARRLPDGYLHPSVGTRFHFE